MSAKLYYFKGFSLNYYLNHLYNCTKWVEKAGFSKVKLNIR